MDSAAADSNSADLADSADPADLSNLMESADLADLDFSPHLDSLGYF